MIQVKMIHALAEIVVAAAVVVVAAKAEQILLNHRMRIRQLQQRKILKSPQRIAVAVAVAQLVKVLLLARQLKKMASSQLLKSAKFVNAHRAQKHVVVAEIVQIVQIVQSVANIVNHIAAAEQSSLTPNSWHVVKM
jgi:hypothetical protein